MTSSVYLETSIISYFTARLNRDLVIAGRQQVTREWWDNHKNNFNLYISELVLREARGGDANAAKARLQILEAIEIIEISPAALQLSDTLIANAALPQKAAADALHIAIAVTNGMDFLLTWNCKHIANATMRSRIERVCRNNEYEPSIICTPEELVEYEL